MLHFDGARRTPKSEPEHYFQGPVYRSDLTAASPSKLKVTELRCFSPQVNYTDRANAACRQCQLLRIQSVAWSAQRISTAVNLGFLVRSRYLSIQVAPHLYSRGWVDPVPDPLLHRKSGSAGNRTRDLWICSQELWPLDYRSPSSII
jgi:hypothetical protein